jgi:nitrous oxide reductase accessory protein NosL
MKSALFATLVLSVALVSGCKQQQNATGTPANTNDQTSATAASMSPEQLGELGAQIKQHPNDASKLLSEHGLTEASFEKAIRQVTQDPDASKRYAAAFRKAKA